MSAEHPEHLPPRELSAEQVRAAKEFFMTGDGMFGRHHEEMFMTELVDDYTQWVALSTDRGPIYVERPHPLQNVDTYTDIALWIPTNETDYLVVAHGKDGAVRERELITSEYLAGSDFEPSMYSDPNWTMENARRNFDLELEHTVEPLDAKKIDEYTSMMKSASEGTNSNLEADWSV